MLQVHSKYSFFRTVFLLCKIAIFSNKTILSLNWEKKCLNINLPIDVFIMKIFQFYTQCCRVSKENILSHEYLSFSLWSNWSACTQSHRLWPCIALPSHHSRCKRLSYQAFEAAVFAGTLWWVHFNQMETHSVIL